MGTHLAAVNCPNCDTTYSGHHGPNFTAIPAPTAPGWGVILLTCVGCKQFMGAYSYPTQQ